MFWYDYLNSEKLRDGEEIHTCAGSFIMHGRILRQKSMYSRAQEQTKDTFAFKWSKRDTYESEEVRGMSGKWLNERYLNNDKHLLKRYIPDGAKILDAGCGAGHSASLFFNDRLQDVHYLGVDISSAVDIAKQNFADRGLQGEFIQSNIINLPFEKPIFDVIFSEGVLHHTDSTEKTFKYLSTLLLKNGVFMFYVYRKKGRLREFSDDYLREYLSGLSDEEAWDALLPLTMLGKALGDLNVEVEVPEAIDYFGIPAGKIDIQRLLYWYVFKAYYKPNWKLEEMNHANFDWYRPKNCHRHTSEEIKQWCSEAGLSIEHIDEQESGITVVARKV